MIALSNRVHIFAHPAVKEKLTGFFTNILGCPPALSLDAPGLTILTSRLLHRCQAGPLPSPPITFVIPEPSAFML